MRQKYDYIIAGAGAAGLSLAWKLLQSPLADKNVLIVDTNLTPENDKTLCFWDSTHPPFSNILYKTWNNVEFSCFNERKKQHLDDYSYHCLRSIDFQEEILQSITAHPNFYLLEGEIIELISTSNRTALKTNAQTFEAEYIFQSCFPPPELTESPPRYPLLQHFLGWEIQVKHPFFDDTSFTLMDFDPTFQNGLAFMYLLPWSKHSALVEYTVFSDGLLDRKRYEEKIALYLNNRFNLQRIDYEIQRREFGKIPMQDQQESMWYKPQILNLGTTGGLTKPSTGYTFKRIQNHSEAIIQGLLSGGDLQIKSPSSRRYKTYDLWLLQIIHDHPHDALRIFNHLFDQNSVDELFRFLGEESSLQEDFKIMSSVPYWPFLRAMWKTAGRLIQI